jgi:8-oxo-dGTP diphosphatase
MRHFRVAAGILRDARGRILIAERVGGGPFQGMWEFPGGKIAVDESATDALARELDEELGIVLLETEHFMYVEHAYPDRAVSIDFFLVSGWKDHPRGIEGQRLLWVEASALTDYELLPADLPVIEALQQIAS